MRFLVARGTLEKIEKYPDRAGQSARDTKKADAENPENSWVCLASALNDLP